MLISRVGCTVCATFVLYHCVLKILLGLISLCMGLCCPSVYITWSHFRSVWDSMMSELICELVFVLSDFLCQLVSFPSCMGLCVVLVSMSVGFTSVLYGSLLSECLWYVVSLPFYMGIYAVSSFYVTWSLCCLILYYMIYMHSSYICLKEAALQTVGV